MSDLLTRARAAADEPHRNGYGWYPCNCGELIRELCDEIELLRGDYAKLHGVVQTYINADPHVRGEAYRDLTGTLEYLTGSDELYGWPAVWQRHKAEIERLRELLSRALDSGQCGYIGLQWIVDAKRALGR